MWIFGIILIGVSGFLVYLYKSKKQKLHLISSTETSTVEFIKSLASSMTEGVGKGHLQYGAEIKGKIECDRPIKSEIAGAECVYYAMKVARKYEETYYITDKDGRRMRQTRTATEILASNRRSVPFYVNDGTGRIKVDPGKAEIIAEKILSRFEPHTGSGGVIRIGSFSFNIPSGFMGGDRRTLGYSFEEEAILTGRDVYVLGEVSDADGELCIQRAPEQGKFIVSAKSEEELTGQIQKEITLMIVGSILCAIAGVVLIIFDFQ